MMRKFYICSFLVLLFSGAVAQERTAAFPSAINNKTVKFYPNPAVSFIYFELQAPAEKSLQLQVINFLGRKVYEGNMISGRNTTINLSDFYRGIYIFQLRDGNGKLIDSGKFQVSK